MNAVSFERRFRVRNYECDAYGHVNHANYLRFMQETAFDASADVGYPIERYEAMNRLWLIRETDITYKRPLAYNDEFAIRTWVEDFRRVRSTRRYELFMAGSGEPVAEARTEWVFLNRETQRPASIPPEMVTAFSDGMAPAGSRPEPFPDAPPLPEGVFRLRSRVEWRDIDGLHHVNNASYLSYVEECNIQAAAAHGWPAERIVAEGIGIVARRYRIEYLQPAVMGDELEITTFVSDVRRSTAVRHNTISRVSDGALLARVYTLWVWVDLTTGRPMRIPAHFLADFAPNIAPA